MKLRRQLLLVSLLTLVLPWAGCQYVSEMENALREGQSVALLATAQAVANRITHEQNLLHALQQPSAQVFSDNQIYAHDFSAPIILDGYDDEWRYRELAIEHWRKQSFELRLQAANFDEDLYLFIQVTDPTLIYYQPHFSSPTHSDHLVVRVLDQQSRPRDYIINASTPGLIAAYYLTGHYQEDGSWKESYQREHRIKGVWYEHQNGYQIELQLPLALTHDYLGVAAVNIDNHSFLNSEIDFSEPTLAGDWIGSIAPESLPKPLIKKSQVLNEALTVFADQDLRLRVTGRNQWLVAQAGKLQSPKKLPAEQNGLIVWLMRNLFTEKNMPVADKPEASGFMEAQEIVRALEGENAYSWYRYGVHTLGRAVVPIVTPDISQRILGTVVVEQTSARILTSTNAAFRRLFFYTLLATLIAGIGLVAYARWLSLRIRRLSQAADNAMREDGKLQNQFPISDAKDEIGDLNRSYAQLLIRLQEYTDYLRSLSNKLSHELRTPLAVVRSSLDNLSSEPLNEHVQIYAVRAQDGAQRLSAILNAISSASRVEESIRSSDMEVFSLTEVIKELTLAYNDIAQQKIIFNCAEDDSFSLYGSPDLIVQMLDKLFDNACDFCPADGEIIFSLARDKQSITLTVSNDGPLLPQKMQSQLFDSLVSLRETDKGSAGKAQHDNKIHLGLGLHIVRLIAEVHQAQVAARNRRDESGVEFIICFPLV